MSADAPRLSIPVSDADHSTGPADASVTLVEYGDFQCPHCKAAREVVDGLLARHGKKLRLIFRHFPLARAHKFAMSAAEASESAAAQGKFWEMHGVLFAEQPKFEHAELAHYARSIGLDVNRFEAEMAAHAHLPRVQADFKGGVRSGVNGTPTFFINGFRHNGLYAADVLGPAVDQAMAGSSH